MLCLNCSRVKASTGNKSKLDKGGDSNEDLNDSELVLKCPKSNIIKVLKNTLKG